MLLNISTDFKETKKKIDSEVGKPFDLEQRQKWEGITRTGFPISAASIEIYNLLVINEGNSTCNIEMRPNGILISFTSMRDTYVFVIPHYKLKVYKGKAEEYSFYRDQQFIKIWAGKSDPEVHKFIKKIIQHKSDNRPPRIEDYM